MRWMIRLLVATALITAFLGPPAFADGAPDGCGKSDGIATAICDRFESPKPGHGPTGGGSAPAEMYYWFYLPVSDPATGGNCVQVLSFPAGDVAPQPLVLSE